MSQMFELKKVHWSERAVRSRDGTSSAVAETHYYEQLIDTGDRVYLGMCEPTMKERLVARTKLIIERRARLMNDVAVANNALQQFNKEITEDTND